MSATTYQVETVHSSIHGSNGMMAQSDPGSYSHFHHNEASAFQQTVKVPPSLETSHQLREQLQIIQQQILQQQRDMMIQKQIIQQREAEMQKQQQQAQHKPPQPKPAPIVPRTCQPQLIATISAGFEKGDYLIREERGSNIYFDFFEEAFNFLCEKGYSRMPKHEEKEYIDVIQQAHRSIPGGCRYNTGRLLLVLRKKLVPVTIEEDDEPSGVIMEGGGRNSSSLSSYKSNGTGSSSQGDINKEKMKKKLQQSTGTLPTDIESSGRSTEFSSASTSFVDSWE